MKKNIAFYSIIFLFAISGCYHDEADFQVEQPVPPPIPPSQFKAFQEIYYNDSELEQIATLVELVPEFLINGFWEKYIEWMEASLDLRHSFAYSRAYCAEYDVLLLYCIEYGKASWPLVLDLVAKGDHCVCSLLRDLIADGKRGHLTEIYESLVQPGVDFPTLTSAMVVYCRKILVDEYDNIVKAIQAISIPETEATEPNVVSISIQEISIKLQSEKDETAFVKIYNLFGGIEYESSYFVPKGEQTIVVNASGLRKGSVYVIQTLIGGKTTSQKIKF